MTDTNARFQGNIPEVYDRELGPVLFEPYATDLARRIDVKPGQNVLEIACGTGIVTGKLRARMPQGTTLVATDLNEAMLMFVPDKEKAAREALRVLAPGGTFVVSVWDRIEHNKFARVTHETITAFYPVDPPTFYCVPFGYADPDVLKRLLETNGFERVTVQNVRLEFRAASARALATGLIEGNPVRSRPGSRPPAGRVSTRPA